jgi:DNA polymerase
MASRSGQVSEILELTRRAFGQRLESEPGLGLFDTEVPPLQPAEPQYKDLRSFEKSVNNCLKCPLGKTRNKFVFGAGNPDAEIVFIGEAPGRDEDLQGEPFVGRAGQLLDKILAAIKFSRQDIYIANILKCRPPGNRDPLPEEAQVCLPILLQQIKMIKPKLLCCLGRVAAQILLDTKTPLGKLRGKFIDYYGMKLMVTYHPAALLRFSSYKADTWEDMKMLRREYDRIKGQPPVV